MCEEDTIDTTTEEECECEDEFDAYWVPDDDTSLQMAEDRLYEEYLDLDILDAEVKLLEAQLERKSWEVEKRAAQIADMSAWVEKVRDAVAAREVKEKA